MVSNSSAKPDMYDWKQHYACPLIKTGEEYGFEHFRIENETGSGTVDSCVLFPGIQAIYNDLHIGRCGSMTEASNEVIEINYCSEGRYVCKLSDRYYFFTGHGDLSIGTVGRREAQGAFPTKRFCAITLFIELSKIEQLSMSPRESLSIDPGTILKLAQTTPRYYQLHDSEELNSIFEVMIKAAREQDIAVMRIKTLELLKLLDDEELTGMSGHPVYLNHRQVEIAKEVHQLITRDISERITNKKLAEALNTSATTIKTSFKGVFGVSIRAYMKQYRLHTAQKLLEETDMSISAVAASVGYTNPGKFTVTFRETFGVTPGGYRKAARANLK